ncbi:MAG: hypothetical protein M0C28_34425 [Candidatus Moduliflexus flocculans]|nr:hypothetical protein [Candidatus Moduliflexus flocculans]
MISRDNRKEKVTFSENIHNVQLSLNAEPAFEIFRFEHIQSTAPAGVRDDTDRSENKLMTTPDSQGDGKTLDDRCAKCTPKPEQDGRL